MVAKTFGKLYMTLNAKPMKHDSILDKLPYRDPFLFVDRLLEVGESHIEGEYTFRVDSWFYQGHFKDRPVTPGVLLTECCAQIGLASFGLYLLETADEGGHEPAGFALTEDQMEYLKPVFPGETVRVRAEKQYYRFGKLKAKVAMYRGDGTLVCRGTLSGMMISEAL